VLTPSASPSDYPAAGGLDRARDDDSQRFNHGRSLGRDDGPALVSEVRDLLAEGSKGFDRDMLE